MRSTLRTLYLGIITLSGLTASAQNSVTVMGSVVPCSGGTYPVWIFSDPGTVPMLDTIFSTDANCNFSLTFHPTTSSGGIAVKTSCDGGLTWGVEDSAAYSTPIDTIVANLNCGGPVVCQAAFTVQQAVTSDSTLIPWHITTTNTSIGTGQMLNEWSSADETSGAIEPTFTFNHPGAYEICLEITADNGNCTSTFCDTVMVDSLGFISTVPSWYDCFNLANGPNLPGTPCVGTQGGTIITGLWDNNCICQPDSVVDCLGILGGPNTPGTPCDDADVTTVNDVWSVDCICEGTGYDCLGIPGGTNIPGTACDDGNPITSGDTWHSDCTCAGTICEAPVLTAPSGVLSICSSDSLVLQAITTGTGPMTYSWTGPGTFYPNSTSQTVYFHDFASGTYHVTVTNACGTAEAEVQVAVTLAPDAGISVDTSICGIPSPVILLLLLDGTPDAGGIWSINGAPHTLFFDPAVDLPGVYVHTVVGTAPCPNATATVTITGTITWYGDADGDGLGDPNVTVQSCTQPTGYVSNAYDECPSVFGTVGSVCDDGNPSTSNDHLSVNCECVGTDSTFVDCLGIPGGSNVVGSFCTDSLGGLGFLGNWDANCICQPGTFLDCLSIPGGSNLPGTACTDTSGAAGTWSTSCICIPDTNNTGCQACYTTTQVAPFTAVFTSCSTGGTAPFTYLWDFSDAGAEPGDPITHVYPGPGTYTVCLNIEDANGDLCNICDSVVVGADGTINPTTQQPCNADFWVIQAYDSTATGPEPIPNEVWVWNLSSGGNGNYQFLWEFGDGSSSTDAYPTHEYGSDGPWNLCLTMYSGGCTDTYCDSVSVDANGILNQLVIGGGDGNVHEASTGSRSGGFTLNVIQHIPTGIMEIPAFAELNAWPNPVLNELNLSFNTSLSGTVPVTVIDPSGRTVITDSQQLTTGSNTFRISTSTLEPGLYMVRIGNDARSITQRFMKVR